MYFTMTEYKIDFFIKICKYTTMEYKKPYYLRHTVEEILADAREHITIHYIPSRGHGGQRLNKVATCCQIIDHNDYGKYFFEPIKFDIPEIQPIKCMEQRSAHQNGLIALKKWETTVRDFLAKPIKKSDPSINWKEDIRKDNEKQHIAKILERAGNHPTPPCQIESLLSEINDVQEQNSQTATPQETQ